MKKDTGISSLTLEITNPALTAEIQRKQLIDRSLRAKAETYRRLVETTDTGYVILDLAGLVMDANEEYLRLTGYGQLSDIIQKSVVEWTAPHDIERSTAELEKCIRFGNARNLQLDYIDLSGTIIPVEINANLVKTDNGLCLLALCRDITDRRRVESRQLLLNELRSLSIEAYTPQQMCEQALSLILQTLEVGAHSQGAIFLAAAENQAFEVAAAHQWPPTFDVSSRFQIQTRLFEQPLDADSPAWYDEYIFDDLPASSDTPPNVYYRFTLSARDKIMGVLFLGFGRHRLDQAHDFDFLWTVCHTLGGIIDRKLAEMRIEQLAYYDTLTGLPNRRLLEDRLKQAIAQAVRHNERLAVIFLDLDRFKAVNDVLGHACGDIVLNESARRISSCVRGSDTVARLGGDEFLIVLTNLDGDGQQVSVDVAMAIARVLSQPFLVEGHNLFITSSLGIAIYPLDGSKPDDLIRNADIAMYHAKEQGRNNFQFFAEYMNTSLQAKLKLEQELRQGLDLGQFELYYQPQVSIASGRIVGVEALLRWHHPERGLLCPSEFLGVAEETGVMFAISEWVLKTGCRQMAAWLRAGLGGAGFEHLSINVSPCQFKQSGFVPKLELLLYESGLGPGSLELEVTEASLMNKADLTLLTLDQIMKLGVRLVIDNFGVGYSCLGYLKDFPLDGLKIDASFVRDLESDPNDAAIIEAIIAMAHRLDLKVIAKAVETEQQLTFLRAQGCDEFQGHLNSPPVPAAQLEKLLSLVTDPQPALPPTPAVP